MRLRLRLRTQGKFEESGSGWKRRMNARGWDLKVFNGQTSLGCQVRWSDLQSCLGSSASDFPTKCLAYCWIHEGITDVTTIRPKTVIALPNLLMPGGFPGVQDCYYSDGSVLHVKVAKLRQEPVEAFRIPHGRKRSKNWS